MPKLTLVMGRNPLKVYDLDQPTIRIGRVKEMDIFIDNPSVSRNQAEIARQADGTWVVRDAGSSNGTFVNGDKLTGDRVLQAGDEISMGKFAVLFERALEVKAEAAPQRAASAPSGFEHGTMFLKADEIQKLQQAAAQKRQAHVDWESKGQKGIHNLAATGAALIGSDELCDLQVPGAPNYVLVARVGEGYEVRHLASGWLGGGMTVRGAKARRAKLKDGDVIEVGGVKLTFKDDLR